MESLRKFIAVILCIVMLCPVYVSASEQEAKDINESIARSYDGEAGRLLADRNLFLPGDSVSDWMAVAFALNGIPEEYSIYLEDLEQYVTEQYEENGCLDSVKASEYHRVILTVLALGGNPEQFAKDANGNPINLLAEGVYNYPGELGKQGINGYTYALLCLDAKGYEVPEDAKYTRKDIIGYILDMQNEDGGFGLKKGTSDIDITAMVLHSMAPYKEQHEEVIEAALTYLAEHLNEKCGYASFGVENTESVAQVILALCALGKDPETEEAFCVGDKTLLTNMKGFCLEDGTYIHSMEETKTNLMATEQALLAFTAVERLREGNTRLYDFKNHKVPESLEVVETTSNDGGIGVIPIVIVIGVCAGGLVCLKKRKKGQEMQ